MKKQVRKQIGKQIAVFLMAVVMLFTSIPMRTFAEEAKAENEAEVNPVVEEDKQLLPDSTAGQKENDPEAEGAAPCPEMAEYTPIDWDSIWASLDAQPVIDMDNLLESDQAIVPEDDMVVDSIAEQNGFAPDIESLEQPELNQADENFGTKCGNFLIDWAVNKAMDWAFDKIMNEIFKDTAPTMDDLLRNQEKIMGMLDRMMSEIKISDYKQDMRNKQIALTNIFNKTVNTNKILNDYKDKKTRIDNLEPLYAGSGKDYCSDVINFANTYLTARASRMPNGCIFNVYDLYAKQYYPWEAQGYGFRENMRNLDLTEFYQSAAIAMLACRAHIDSNSKLKAGAQVTLDQLEQTVREVRDNTGKYTVKRLPANETLFQVPGKQLHFIWDLSGSGPYGHKGMTDWFEVCNRDLSEIRGKAARWTLEEMSIKSGKLNNNKYHAPDESDYKKMVNYYKDAGTAKTLNGIMKDSGIDVAYVDSWHMVYPTNYFRWRHAKLLSEFRYWYRAVPGDSTSGNEDEFNCGYYSLDEFDEAGKILGWAYNSSDRSDHYVDKVFSARIFIVR